MGTNERDGLGRSNSVCYASVRQIWYKIFRRRRMSSFKLDVSGHRFGTAPIPCGWYLDPVLVLSTAIDSLAPYGHRHMLHAFASNSVLVFQGDAGRQPGTAPRFGALL